MSDEQIEFMLTNRVPFGLLEPYEQEWFRAIPDWTKFLYFSPMLGFTPVLCYPIWGKLTTYRLAERPKPEPVVERHAVTYDAMDYAVYGEDDVSLDMSSIRKGFAGYEFADGTVDYQHYRKPGGEMCKYVREPPVWEGE